MKSVKIFSLVAFMAVVLASCSNFEKVLPKNDGTWNIDSQTEREFENGTLVEDTTYNNAGTIMFSSDGTGSWTDSDTTNSFTWTADTKNDVLTICQDFFGAQFCFPFDVLESSKDAQKWMFTQEDDSTRSELEMTLSRVE